MDTDDPRDRQPAAPAGRAPVAGIAPILLTPSLADLDLPDQAPSALARPVAAGRDRAARGGRQADATRALLAGGARDDRRQTAAAVARVPDKPPWPADPVRFIRRHVGETGKTPGRVFGRRTAVRDAHDRYANLPVNCPHGRLDAYPGPVPPATNQRPAPDGAFGRRLNGVVDFPWRAPPRGT